MVSLVEKHENPTAQEFKDYLNRRTREHTAVTYMWALGRWFRWLRERAPSHALAQEFIDELEVHGSSPNTVNVYANAIKRWYKWKGEELKLDAPGIHIGEPTYITMVELELVIKESKTVLERVLVVVLFDTAARISELLGLELKDINWDSSLIRITLKGGRIADANVSERGMAVLKEWLKRRQSKSKRVFMDVDYLTALNAVKKAGKRAGVRLTPHMLRHSKAIWMLEQGVEPHIVQQHLRHTNIGTTLNVYGRFKPMALKEKIPEW